MDTNDIQEKHEEDLRIALEQRNLLKELIRLTLEKEQLEREHVRLSKDSGRTISGHAIDDTNDIEQSDNESEKKESFTLDNEESEVSSRHTNSFLSGTHDEEENERSIQEVSYYMQMTKEAMNNRAKWMLEKKKVFLNQVREVDHHIEELNKMKQEMELLHSSFDRDTTIEQTQHNCSSNSSTTSDEDLTELSKQKIEKNRLLNELQRAQQALIVLRHGIQESSSLPSKEMRSIYMSQFLEEFESQFGDFNTQLYQEQTGHTEGDDAITSEREDGYNLAEASDYSDTSTVSKLSSETYKEDMGSQSATISIEHIIPELEQLIYRNKNNLDFVYMLLREARNITSGETRMQVLNFFRNLGINGTNQLTSGVDKKITQQPTNARAQEHIGSKLQDGKKMFANKEVRFENLPVYQKTHEEMMLEMREDIRKLVITLVSPYDQCSLSRTFNYEVVNRLSLNIFDLTKIFFNQVLMSDLPLTIEKPQLNSELLKTLSETINVYYELSVTSTLIDNLVNDVMDAITDELHFRKTLISVNNSFQQDIEELTGKLAEVMKKRKEDITKIRQQRSRNPTVFEAFSSNPSKLDLNEDEEDLEIRTSNSDISDFDAAEDAASRENLLAMYHTEHELDDKNQSMLDNIENLDEISVDDLLAMVQSTNTKPSIRTMHGDDEKFEESHIENEHIVNLCGKERKGLSIVSEQFLSQHEDLRSFLSLDFLPCIKGEEIEKTKEVATDSTNVQTKSISVPCIDMLRTIQFDNIAQKREQEEKELQAQFLDNPRLSRYQCDTDDSILNPDEYAALNRSSKIPVKGDTSKLGDQFSTSLKNVLGKYCQQ